MSKKKIDEIIEEVAYNQDLRLGVGQSTTVASDDSATSGEGKYPPKVTLFVRRDGLNTYHIKATVSSRWDNHNYDGLVSKVCSNSSGAQNTEWVRATKKPWDNSNTIIAEKTVEVSSSGSFYGILRCMHCEYETPHHQKYIQKTPGISYTYVNPEIIPGKPTTGKPSNTSFYDGTYDVYAGGNITITNSGGSNAVSRKIHLECYYPSSGWATWTPNASFNSWSGASGTLSASFDGTGNNRGYIYRVTCHTKSSTGHTASNTTYYFKVNDLPRISGFKSSVKETQNSFTLSHSGVSDSYHNGLRTKYYYKKDNKWVAIADGGNSYGLNITNYGSVGSTIEFGAQPYDGLEWGSTVGGVFVKRIQIYSKPALVMEAASNSTTFNYQNAKVYCGDQKIYFAVVTPGNYDKCLIKIGYYDHKDGNKWKDYSPSEGGFNQWNDAPNPYHNFSSANNDRGYKWAVQAQVKSASGNITNGDWVEFWINDLPNSGNFSGSTSRTRDEVTISWSAPVDKLNEGSFRYQIANYKNGSHTIISESSGGSSKKISLLAAGASKGETVTLKMRVKDYLEYGPWSSGSVTVKMNSDPYFDANSIITSDKDSAHYNKYFDDYINFTFPIIRDADTTTGSQYRIEYSVYNGTSWGSWVHLENRTSSAYNKNFASIVPRGHKLRLQVKPVDDLGAIGAGKISQTYTRVELPQPPSSMTLHSQKFKDEHYETLEKVSWSKGHSTSGKIDRYKCILQAIGDNGSVNRESVHETSSLEASPALSFINRGENFRIRIQAKDIFGNWSSTISSGLHSRNKVPNKVNNFKATGSKINFYNTVPLAWDTSSDPDGDNVTYEIYHRTELGPWRLVAERISKTNYSHSISGYNPGVKLGYKIVPVDELGAKGTETVLVNSDNITVNTPPTACIPFAPFDSPVFSKRPRLLIESVVEDQDKDDLILEVVLDGVTYTSSANPELFNKRIFSSTEKASFRPPHDLTPGSHLVKFRTYDGMQYSPAVQETIEIRAMLENNKVPRVDYITASSINKCCQMLETNYVAYKESPRRKTFIKGSAITASQINSIYKDAYDLTKHITSLSNGLNDSHSLIVSSRHNKIGTDWFNNMIKIIETL